MRRFHKAQFVAACVAFAVSLAPVRFVAAETPEGGGNFYPAAIAVADAALAADGALHGQVVDANGIAAGSKPVMAQRSDGWQMEVSTNAEGRFHVENLRGGIYAISAGGPTKFFRVWSEGTAPPSARSEILLVGGDSAQRANDECCWWKNPWLWVGVVAVAVAVPVIINALDDAS